MPQHPWKPVSVCLVLLFVVALANCRVRGQVYNLHLVTDNQPDYTDFESFVASSTRAWESPEEKAIAVWRWGRRSRHQLSCSREGTRYIMDPILNYNSHGALNCGIISSLNLSSWLQLGYQARYVQLGDHTVSEVSWDQGKSWHLFDSSMSVFCYNHKGEIASCEEIKEAHGCELSGGKVEPGHYYFYHPAPQCASHLGPTGWRCASDNPVEFYRTLAKGAESYTDGFSVDRYCQYARYGHRYVLNLRPYESYTRAWTPGDNGHLDASRKNADYFRPLPNGVDPDGQKELSNLRANGEWIFEPNLAEKDCEKLFYESAGMSLFTTAPKLRGTKAGARNHVIFQISAANVITSMKLEAEGILKSDSDLLRICVSRNAGIRWQEVWRSEKAGAQQIKLKLREEVAGGPFCWIKLEVRAAENAADAGIDRLKVTTTTLLNRLTMPALTLGSNVVQLTTDEQADTVELWPFLHAGQYKETVFAAEDVSSDETPDGMYKATLGAGANNKECSVTWRMQVPSDIVDVWYCVISTIRSPRHWVSLQHSWDGKQFESFYHHSNAEFPFDRRTERLFREGEVPSGAREAYFRGVFYSPSAAGTYNMAGMQDLLIRVRHKPREGEFKPFEVTYNWTEHRVTGEVTRSHTELVTKLPHRYSVNVAGRRDPTMNWVRMNLPGHSPDKSPVRYGYSDGVDVGPGYEYAKVSYRWGKNVAEGKVYKTSRVSSTVSGNPDTGGKELTDGTVIAPTDYATSKNVQEATAFWEAGEPVSFVLDLGSAQKIGGVRVNTHQPNARYCHPKLVEVSISADGQSWERVGEVQHDDLWKPAGDYEPWEHDQDWKYAALPAGGRLAYGFPLAFATPVQGRYVRFVCTPLEGKGMGISELQVFDAVTTRPWSKEIWLPEVAPGKL